MKFCDKLPKLRKANNITQEQLADMLGVSRQAVSKWESGLSIPDMEKIIEMCKIFKCPIEELLDDGVTSNTKIQPKKSPKEYIISILEFITKSYKMFCSMKFKEKIKCLFELIFIIGFQIIIYAMVGIILGNLLVNIINFLPYIIYDLIISMAELIYVVFAIIFGSIITIHLFKVRYLNYFVFVDDKIEKTTEKERQILEKPTETIIIRDLKEHSSIIKKLLISILKIILVFIAVPLIFTFTLLTALTAFDFIYLKDGLIFLGIFIGLLGTLSLNYLFLYFIYKYLFNLKINLKWAFIIIISSLLALGIGAAITFSSFLTFTKINNEIEYKQTTVNLSLDNIKYLDLITEGYVSRKDIKIDENVDGVELVIEYIGAKPEVYYYEWEYSHYALDIYAPDDPIFYINLIIKDFKNKNIRYYDELYNYNIKEVRIASKNLNKIS